MIGSYGAAKLMTSAKFVNWLADGLILSGTRGFVNQADHMARLLGIAKAEPWLSGIIDQYLGAVKKAEAKE